MSTKTLPQENGWFASFFALAPLLFGGAVIGGILERMVASPTSLWTIVGLVLLPISLVASFVCWSFFASIFSLFAISTKAAKTRSVAEAATDESRQNKARGKFVLLIVAPLICVLCGVLVAFWSPHSWMLVVVAHGLVGLIFGGIMFVLAQLGVLERTLRELFLSNY